MPRGPRGERRPADVNGNAVHVVKIATGEVEENPRDPALEYARQGGLKGGKSRREAQQEAARRDRKTGGKSSLGKG